MSPAAPPPATTATPALEARSVSKVYADGTRALVGIDLAVAAGETIALVGESGCGKTTLLRLFNRMTAPSSGTVLVGGRAVADVDPVLLRRSLGYVQQEGGLLPHWRVERNVDLVPRLLGWDRERRRRRVAEMLALVRLPAGRFARRYPHELSGGQRQRVALARALAADPAVVLLDEPFGALDALTRNELQEQFRDLRGSLAKTVVLVTHDLAEAFLLADRVGVLRAGRLLQLAPPAELETAPADPYVARLLARRPRGGARIDA